MVKPVVAFVFHEAGASPTVGRDGIPEFAMGVPVYVRGKPYVVICPVASRVPALRNALALLILFAATERERSRIAVQAAPGQRVEVLSVELPPTLPVPAQREQGGLTIKQAVNRMFGLDGCGKPPTTRTCVGQGALSSGSPGAQCGAPDQTDER